jgi:hypothetical protein
VFNPKLQATILRQYRDCKALYSPEVLLTSRELARLGVGRGNEAPVSRWCSDPAQLCGEELSLRQLTALAYSGKAARWAELPGPGLSEYLLKPRHGQSINASVGPVQFQEIYRSVTEWQRLSYFRHFLQLYNYARGFKRADLEQHHRFVLLMAFLAFQGVPEKQLHILLTVASNQSAFEDVDPPDPGDDELFMEPHRNSFERREIVILAEEFCCDWIQYQSNMGVNPDARVVGAVERRRLTSMRTDFKGERAKFTEEIADCVEEAFPRAPERLLYTNKKIFTGDATDLLNLIALRVSSWAQNKRLTDFWIELEQVLADPEITVPAVKLPPLLPWAELPQEIPSTETAAAQGVARMCHGCQRKVCQCERVLPGVNPFTQAIRDTQAKCGGVGKDKNLSEKYRLLSPDRAKKVYDAALHEFNEGRAQQDLGSSEEAQAGASKRARKDNDGDVGEAFIPPMPAALRLGLQDENCMARASFDRENAESWRAHHLAEKPGHGLQLDEGELLKMLELYTRTADVVWETFVELYLAPPAKDFAGRTLKFAGLWPTSHPALVLQCLLPDRKAPQLAHPEHLKETLGAYVILRQRAQRAERCLELLLGHKTVKLQRELENKGHDKFKPVERPEWLLFEYENNLLIRPMQVVVAESMMKDGVSMTMQLNMGEGKTTVIVPMLLLSLADGNRLARLTVLKSLFRTNVEDLTLKLGGIFGRRIYTLPCRRDLKIGTLQAQLMEGVYRECLRTRGVVVALPEHRMSFELVGLEHAELGRMTHAKDVHHLQTFLEDKCRDIVDESDEVFHVRHQLVYTMGAQHTVGGGALRWKVSQAILRVVARLAADFYLQHPEGVEHQEVNGGFPFFRLISDDAEGQAIYQLLIEHICAELLSAEPKDGDELPLLQVRGRPCCTVVILLLHCCYTVVTLLLHCCYTVVALLLHYCHTIVTLLLH